MLLYSCNPDREQSRGHAEAVTLGAVPGKPWDTVVDNASIDRVDDAGAACPELVVTTLVTVEEALLSDRPLARDAAFVTMIQEWYSQICAWQIRAR